ncbi:hypothetical protein EJC49_12400 [Aquibium carbonis]|uniref:Uncharacterized protein n=1 Tax=Aquibium carbonis TaxID=2495581 RepID=A0A3R9YSH1_9HYPH|nr:hypothetical protein [Aquibium carbonis]RST86093.1 hypothetical protein EJC49_12400 [Aquibium carbonis]
MLAINSALGEELVGHAVRSVEAAETFSDPFPHIFFRDFFPTDFYARLLEAFPPDDRFDRLKGDGTRLALRLYGDHVDRIDNEQRALWSAVSAVLVSERLEAAVRAKLAEGLEIRRRGEKVASVDDLRTIAKPVIYKDVDGYEIKPHPDTRKKVITMQLYCPADESQMDLGTTLYRASAKGLLNPGSYFLEPTKTLPFAPNVGYAFVVLKAYHTLTRMSWHGRPKITAPVERPRMSILNTFYTDETLGF